MAAVNSVMTSRCFPAASCSAQRLPVSDSIRIASLAMSFGNSAMYSLWSETIRKSSGCLSRTLSPLRAVTSSPAANRKASSGVRRSFPKV